MKAIRHTRYGPPDLLELREIERPVPKAHQVLIKVRAASVNAIDYRTMRADPSFMRLMGVGLVQPKDPHLGIDVAGVVEAVGEEARRFRPGDEVFGGAHGSFAEYAPARESRLAPKPASISYEQAAALPIAGLTALQALRDVGRLQPGQKVLIQGASGGVGTFAIQLARVLGAAEVTAVCSPRNLELARSLGADQVMDYTREDFTRSGRRYDLILAVNGYHPLAGYRRALNPGGTYVCAGGTASQIMQAALLGPLMSKLGRRKLGMMGIAKLIEPDLTYLAELLAAGKLVARIDRTYPLRELPEAIRYIEGEHAQGKVVITVEHDGKSG